MTLTPAATSSEPEAQPFAKGLLKYLRTGGVATIPSHLLWLCGPLSGAFGVCDQMETSYVGYKGVLLTFPCQATADLAAAELCQAAGRKFKVIAF